MIITDVECIMLRLPEVLPIGDSTQDTLIVKVHTDEGIVGIGECHTSPWILKAVIEAPVSAHASRGLKEIVVGQNPLSIGSLWDRMYELSMVYGRRGLIIQAMSAIDMALWDILGKVCGQPVHQLLGGSRRDDIPAYASTLAAPDIKSAIREVQELVDQGFRAIKFGWGNLGKDLKSDLQFVEKMREAAGTEVDLMVDVGMPMPIRDAKQLAQGLAALGVFFLEEPLSPDDLDGYAALVGASPLPIACGEKETTRFGFRDLIERGQVDIIQPDVARAGGFTECRRIADMADLHGTQVIPHCWSTDILVSATLNFIATLSDCPYLEFCVVDNPIRRSVIQEPIEVVDGMVSIPNRPGLGLELNDKIVEDLRY